MENESNNHPEHSFLHKLKDNIYRRKFLHTVILFVSNIILGLRNGQHATAFLDLAQITGTTVEQASLFYTIMGVGSITGTLLMGFLFDKLTNHKLLLLASACLIGSITTTGIPWSTDFLLTVVLFFVNSTLNAAFDTGTNADILFTWGVDGKMFMHFMHFCYSVGAIISPFTVRPFLSTPITNNGTNCTIAGTLQPQEPPEASWTSESNSSTSETNSSSILPACEYTDTRIHYAYMIAAALTLVSGIALAVEGCFYRLNTKAKEDDKHRNPNVLPKWLVILILFLIASMYFFHCSATLTILGYVMAFFVKGLGWSKSKSSGLYAIIWGGVASARLLAVICVKWVSPGKMLIACHSGVFMATCGMWLSVVQDTEWGLWLCLLMFSLAAAAIYPTGIVYLENDALKVTGKVTSVVWLAGNIQAIAMAPLIGYLLEEVSYMWYIYLALIERVFAFLSFGILVLVVRTLIAKYRQMQIVPTEEPDEKISD